MMLKTQTLRISRNTILLFTIFVSLILSPIPALALGHGNALPNFAELTRSVQPNQAGLLRWVDVPGVLALPVVQQPVGSIAYVSTTDGEITQFEMASEVGNVGLLAHNNLSGRYFTRLNYGQEVRLVYGDGTVEYFVVTQIVKFQALQPTNPYSSFRDLTSTELLSARQLFDRVYRGDRHVTFQTCIDANGDASWGRLFVIATPRPHHS